MTNEELKDLIEKYDKEVNKLFQENKKLKETNKKLVEDNCKILQQRIDKAIKYLKLKVDIPKNHLEEAIKDREEDLLKILGGKEEKEELKSGLDEQKNINALLGRKILKGENNENRRLCKN